MPAVRIDLGAKIVRLGSHGVDLELLEASAIRSSHRFEVGEGLVELAQVRLRTATLGFVGDHDRFLSVQPVHPVPC